MLERDTPGFRYGVVGLEIESMAFFLQAEVLRLIVLGEWLAPLRSCLDLLLPFLSQKATLVYN